MAEPIFEVDKEGLAKLLDSRPNGKAFAIYEILSNAWDQNVSVVKLTFEPIEGRRARARLIVEDDDPEGFLDLSHAYTLFAESSKGADPEKRGRFNLGEKLVLSICDEATIASTKGTVSIDSNGRVVDKKARREVGSVFDGVLRMTKPEYEAALATIRTLLPPDGITTLVNGEPMQPRIPDRTIQASLATVLADAEGFLRPTRRKARVEIHEPRAGEKGTLYELGMPVVETGDRWHVNVLQKIPLNADRDNVTPAYLREVRTLVANEMAQVLSEEEATATWVDSALEDPNIESEAVEAIVTKRYGEKRVIFDPSDPEGTKLAVSKGYTVIPSRAFTKDQWTQVKSKTETLPAGQVTPSPKPYDTEGDSMAEDVPRDQWTQGQEEVAEYGRWLARRLLGIENLRVRMVRSQGDFIAAWTRSGPELQFNLAKLQPGWFRVGTEHVDAVLIHEMAHQECSDHLSEEFHFAMGRVAGKFIRLVKQDPEVFQLLQDHGMKVVS